MSSQSKEIVIRNDIAIAKFVTIVTLILTILMFVLPSNEGGFTVARILVTFVLVPFPLLCGALWMRTFKVVLTTEGVITVRKIFLTKKFKVTDIKKVIHRMTYTNVMQVHKMDVKVKGCNFSVDSNMDNFEIFEEYIKDNIPSDKIIVKKIDKRNPE